MLSWFQKLRLDLGFSWVLAFQEGGWMGERIIGEEPIFAVSSLFFSSTTGGQVPGDVEEEQCKSTPSLPTQKSKTTKGKRVIVKKESGYDSTSRAAAPTYPCKSTDGKQWQCRRSTHKPNSLCDYYLTQIKSYNYKSPFGYSGG